MKTYGININTESLTKAAADTANWPKGRGWYSAVYYDPADGEVWTRDENESSYGLREYPCVLRTTRHVSAQRIADAIKEYMEEYMEDYTERDEGGLAMRHDYCQYEDLKAAALAPNATQEAVDDLGRWFQQYDPYDWNGEYYTVDEANQIRLWPVLAEDEDGNFEVTHYSFDRPW